MVLQPAIWAGTAIMSVLLGSTAVPPGTYKPTAPALQLLVRALRDSMLAGFGTPIASIYLVASESKQRTRVTQAAPDILENGMARFGLLALLCYSFNAIAPAAPKPPNA